MLRRTFLLAAPAVSALGLTACGFALRQAPNYPFATIFVRVAEGSSLGNELKRNLAAGGKLEVVTDPKRLDSVEVVLEVITDQREKSVASLTSAGQVREFQLRSRVKFRLRTPQGKELITDTEILQQRDISYTETQALSKEAEEQLLYRNMQTDIVQQIMRRIASVQAL
ncbi:LPS assembly lipoprotein LptE [Rhodoferax sp.]|uniref:LPS-assembly lipoprotein LptE n=1 Tax=Rhodoferax sp. TaxID=50421 RepID=UPI0025E9ADEE|nr:LPS assembly lipoprotein LptE [Rhodoferax sp.]